MQIEHNVCAVVEWPDHHCGDDLLWSTCMCLRQERVLIRVVFLKIGEINTALETFSADVFIQARWREPLFDRKIDLVRLIN